MGIIHPEYYFYCYHDHYYNHLEADMVGEGGVPLR